MPIVYDSSGEGEDGKSQPCGNIILGSAAISLMIRDSASFRIPANSAETSGLHEPLRSALFGGYRNSAKKISLARPSGATVQTWKVTCLSVEPTPSELAMTTRAKARTSTSPDGISRVGEPSDQRKKATPVGWWGNAVKHSASAVAFVC